MSDDKRDKGRFLERPEGAAPEFDSESGREASLVRWEGQKARNRQSLVTAVALKLGLDPEVLDYDNAMKIGLLEPLFLKAMEESQPAAVKLSLQLLGEMPEGADAKVIVDKRQVKVMNFHFTTVQARAYIEDQRKQGNDFVASLVDNQMNWEADENEIITVKVPLNDKD